MKRCVPKVKRFVSRLKGDKSTPPVPANLLVDPPVEIQRTACERNLTSLDSTGAPQRIWNQAYDELRQPENEQAIVEAYEKILTTYLSPTTQTTQGSNGPQNLIDGDPTKRWKQMEQLVQEGLEKTAKDADRKEKVNQWISITQPLREAVSTGIKAAPAAAIPWAGICCALQACSPMNLLSSPLTEPIKNRDGMTYVLSRMQWYWELWRLVLDENLSSSPTRPLQTELEKQVTTLYRNLLLYQMKSVITYHRNRFVIFLRDLPKLDDWETLLSEIKDAEIAVMRDCEQYSTLEMRITLQGILSSANQQAKQMTDIFHQNQTQYAWEREERHKEKDDICLRDLYKTDPCHDRRSLISAKGGLLYDSYHWVTENQQYKQWYEARSSSLLWIKGDPGKGKTMLICGIIDELEKSAPNGVFYFFCQASDPSLRSANYVLRGLIWTLVRTRPSLISHVRQQYDQAGADVFVNHNAWQALSEMLTAILNDEAATDCVFAVDALDECTDGQEKLIDLISRLSNTCKARWVISSRNWQTIEMRLDSVTADSRLQLELNATAIADAVHHFINHKIKELARGKRLNDDIRTKLHDHLIANADNTFLWVALVCQELAKLDFPSSSILKVASEFPSGLTRLYERMMTTMKDSRYSKLCEAVLAISVVTIRPPTLWEITTLDGRLEDFSEDIEAITHIVRSCGSFLTIREDTVHIVHQSARDHLVDASEIFPSSLAQQHYEVFVSSLRSMHKKLCRNMYKLESTVLIDEITPPATHPLNGMQYACIYWINHFEAWYSAEGRSSGLDNSAYGLLLTFFTTKCLYWFEAMSLLHHVSGVIKAVQRLQNLIQCGPQDLNDLIEDAVRWTLTHRSIMDAAPMQLYNSALPFSPQGSKIRQNFATEAPVFIQTMCPSFQKWDACLQTIVGISSESPWLECSPDRTKFATIGEDNVTIWILDALTGDRLKSIRSDGGGTVVSVSYHPDGRHLASLSKSRQIRIWDIDRQECLQYFQLRRNGELFPRNWWEINPLCRLRFSTDGRFLALYAGNQAIELWDVWQQACLHTLYDSDLHYEDEIRWFGWGLDHSNIPLLLAVKKTHKQPSFQIDFWHSETGQHLSNQADIGSYFRDATVSPDRRRIAVATDEGVSIVRWHTSLTVQKVNGTDSMAYVNDITWAADGRSLAIAAESGILTLDLEKQAESFYSSVHSKPVHMIRYGEGNRLASIDAVNHTLKIWSVEVDSDLPDSDRTLIISQPLLVSQGPKDYLAIAKNRRNIEFVSLTTGNAQQSISHTAPLLSNFRFGPESYFAFYLGKGILGVWDLESGNRTNQFQIYDEHIEGELVRGWPPALAFGVPNLIATIGRQLKVWNLTTGTSLLIPNSFEQVDVRVCSCSSDGRLAFNWNNSEVAVWSSDWTKEREHSIEISDVDGLSFNANGLLLIQTRQEIEVWNCEDGSMVRNYKIPNMITTFSSTIQLFSHPGTTYTNGQRPTRAMDGVPSLPSQRQPAIVSLFDKWRPNIATRPNKTPEEAFQETYQAAVDQYNIAIVAADPHKPADKTTFKHRRDLVFDCSAKLKELEEQHEETREEQQRVYERNFEEKEDAYAFEWFDVLGRERVDDLARRWRERSGQGAAASAKPRTSTIDTTIQPGNTSQTNAPVQPNTTQQPKASTHPDTAPAPDTSSLRTAPTHQDDSSRQTTAPQPIFSSNNFQAQATEHTTPSLLTSRNGMAHEATLPSVQASTNGPTANRSDIQNETEQFYQNHPNGFQYEGQFHSGISLPQKDSHATTSHKRQASSSTTNAHQSKKRATPCAPGEHSQGRTIEFDEVYQNGNAASKYVIVQYLQNWYIVECEEHKMMFLKQPLKAASKHLSSGKHRMENPGHAGVIRELGTHVLNCNEGQAKMNNEVSQRQSYDQIGLPDSRVSSSDTPTVTHSLYTRSSQGISGIDPKPGEVYTAYWKSGKKWYAALILPWGSFGGFGWNMSLQSTGIIKKVPKCYLFDRNNPQATPEWAEDYRPGGPYYSKREYPVMYFDTSVFPGKYSMGWVAAVDLQHYDSQAKHIPYRDVVDKFIQEQRLVRNDVEMGHDVVPEHDDTTDPLYSGTTEPNDDRPNAEAEHPEPHDIGMSWEQGILISDCESEPEDRADAHDDHCPRKVSESLQPNLSNMPDHPVTRNETTHQPQAPMNNGVAPHHTNNHPVTASRTRLEGSIGRNNLARTDSGGWPPSVDELMAEEEHFEMWRHACHSLTEDPIFNGHGSRDSADQAPKSFQSDSSGQIPT
ncbi:hypothetical protein ACHAPI_003972 [Fusarium lateritium]